MAYISAIDEEKDEQQPAPQMGAAPAPAVAPVGPVAQQAQTQQPAQSKFVNFSRYLNANRDSAQTTANQMTGEVAKQSDQVQQSTLQAYRTGQKALQSHQPLQYVQQHPKNSANDTYELGKVADQQYTAPTKALSEGAGWGDLQKQAAELQGRANLYGTSYGLGAALQERSAGQYGSGARRFDQALVGTVGADQFAGLRDRYGKLSDYLSQADASSKSNIAAQQTAADQAIAGAKGIQQARVDETAADMDAVGKRQLKGTYGEFNTSVGGIPENVYLGMSFDEVQQARSLKMRGDPALETFTAQMNAKYGDKARTTPSYSNYAMGV